MQIKRKEHRLAYIIICGALLTIGMVVCLINFYQDQKNNQLKADFYTNQTITSYSCRDEPICPQKQIQSSDQISCCDHLGDCSLKVDCINQHLEEIKNVRQVDVIIVSFLLTAIICMVIGCSCYSYSQMKKISRMKQNNRNDPIRQRQNQPRGGGGGIVRKENERRKPLLQSFSLYDQQNTCCICLATFDQDQKAAMLPCGHLYHSKCIKDWIAVSQECPICRRKQKV